MAKFETNMGFVRAVASWQPITKNAAGNMALENIAIMIDGDEILVMATDRYRAIYARVTPTHMDKWEGKKLFPISVFTDAVTVHKTIRDQEVVVFDMPNDTSSFTVTVVGKILEYATPMSSFPALENLLADWKRVETWPNDKKMNMKLLADLTKFADPNEGVVTAAKRDYGWIMSLGESSAIRFHQGNIERFGILVMPMTVR